MNQVFGPGDQVVLATHNPDKVAEIKELLASYEITVLSAGDLGLPEPEETGTTFKENAELKARLAAEATGHPALADDSGIEVAALDGAPGVYSADWSGPSKDFTGAMKRVHDEVQKRGRWYKPGPIANFNATLALAWTDGNINFFVGKVYGHLVWPPRGAEGFGYDPFFRPEGHSRTFGEMTKSEKSNWQGNGAEALSHRARALRQFVESCVYPASQS
ncbi:MAG: RdgB/HAM1 family non-canonical purine NTP pyrophosphatase [Hyphomicrobiaceae bacterium]